MEDLGLGDHFGQRAVVVNLGFAEYIPVAFAGVAIEELDSAQQNRLRAAGRFFTNDFIQEEVSNLVLADLVGRAPAEFCQFLDRTGVAIDSSLGQASKLQIGNELGPCRTIRVFTA